MPDPQPDTNYDPDAVFDAAGPIDPWFMADAIQALMRAHPLDTPEPENAQQRHLQSALTALAATNSRDPIEVMLAVQALSAHQAACVCWRIAMNSKDPGRDRTRHIAAAATAARTCDTMLRAIERRQAKPLGVPLGRPASKVWSKNNAGITLEQIADRIRHIDKGSPADESSEPPVVWDAETLALAERMFEEARIEKENEDLDIANTDGILPGGGMILMEHPTPQQEAYMGRRLGLMYKREIEENRRNGITKMPKIRPIWPGDLIP